MEEKIDKVYKISIAIIVIVSLNLIITFFSNVSVKSNNTATNESDTTASSDDSSNYDVSMMKTLTLSDLIKLFDDTKNTYVVYLGRANCSACVSFLPTLQKMQNKYGYTTQYLDIRTVDTSSDDYQKLMNKLSKKVTLTVSGEQKTDSFGSFYGYTPMTFVIKKGEFSDGIVGAYSESKFESFLNNNGIK